MCDTKHKLAIHTHAGTLAPKINGTEWGIKTHGQVTRTPGWEMWKTLRPVTTVWWKNARTQTARNPGTRGRRTNIFFLPSLPFASDDRKLHVDPWRALTALCIRDEFFLLFTRLPAFKTIFFFSLLQCAPCRYARHGERVLACFFSVHLKFNVWKTVTDSGSKDC